MQTQEYDVETINRLYAVNAELLEALEAAYGSGDWRAYPETDELIRAAIAKAKP